MPRVKFSVRSDTLSPPRQAHREEAIMVKIKHIAIRTPDPEKTAAFYKDVFGLKEVGQARTGYYLSDGHINLAILKAREQGTEESPRDASGYAGVHHFGFMVDDVDETRRKLEAAGGVAPPSPPGGRPAAPPPPRPPLHGNIRGAGEQKIDNTKNGRQQD